MPVALRSVGVSPGATSTSCVIVKPSGLAEDDLMIAHVVASLTSATPASSSAPGGWTQIRQDIGARVGAALFWKIATSGDASATDFTFTVDYDGGSGGCNIGAISAWTGHDAATPINANNGQYNTFSATITSPAITPSVAECMILMIAGIDDDNTQSAYAIATDDPGGWTEAYDILTGLNSDCAAAMGYDIRTETTSTGNGTATTSTADQNVGQLVAIAPAVTAYEESCSDGLGVGDTNAQNLTIDLTITDGLKPGDAPGSLASLIALSSDGVELGDISLAELIFQSLATDGMKLGEALLTQLETILALTDGVKIGDTTDAWRAFYVSLAEGVNLGEALATLKQSFPITTDGVELGDSTSTIAILFSSILDGVSVGDTLATLRTTYPTLTDGLKLSDLSISEIVILLSVSDGIKIGDSNILWAIVLARLLILVSSKSRMLLNVDKKASLRLNVGKKSDMIITLKGGG